MGATRVREQSGEEGGNAKMRQMARKKRKQKKKTGEETFLTSKSRRTRGKCKYIECDRTGRKGKHNKHTPVSHSQSCDIIQLELK